MGTTYGQFAEKHKVTLSLVAGPWADTEKPRTPDGKPWQHNAWLFDLTGPFGMMRVPWRSGLGVVQKSRFRDMKPKPRAPTVGEVLYCLAADSSSADQSFADWCSEYGEDTDSKRAEATWNACRETRENLLDVLGRDGFNELLTCEEG